MVLNITVIALATVLLGIIWRLHQRLEVATRRGPRPPRPDEYPSITVIRPIRGLDVDAAENIQAALANGYPGDVETLFVFDDEDEPAIPLVREAIAKLDPEDQRNRARVLFCGAPPPGRTGKLNAMIAGLQQAKGDLIAFADSDTRVDKHALAVLVETLLSKHDIGAAFAPVVVTPQPSTVGDAGYALLLNALYGSVAAAAAAKHGGELPFIMGQFMVFRRETIEAIGGLESAQGQLVDDMYIGARVKAAGYRNMMSPRRVAIIQQGLTLAQFAAVYRRWMAFSRSGLPGWSFKGTPLLHAIAFWVGLVLAPVSLWAQAWVAAAMAALVPIAVAASIKSLHRAFGGARLQLRHALAPLWLILSSPAIFATIWIHHEVNWRGRTYELNAASRLADGTALAANEPATPPRGHSITTTSK